MKLVMTLSTRDDADIIDAQIAFHLNAGVDAVVATDHASTDGTLDILTRYERAGYVRLVRGQGDLRKETSHTRMARLAATELGADWVFAVDASEFWWPRGSGLKNVLDAVPTSYGVLRAFCRNFVPRPDDGAFFAERMTVRLSPTAPIPDSVGPWLASARPVWRARADVTTRAVEEELDLDLVPLRGWHPIEVLRFPVRTRSQFERQASGADSNRAGGTEGYDELVVSDDEIERGLEDGVFVLDTRLRDALRALAGASQLRPDEQSFELPRGTEDKLRFPRPSLVDETAYAVDAATLGEAEVLEAQRRMDELELRLATVEGHMGMRLERRVRALLHRAVRR